MKTLREKLVTLPAARCKKFTKRTNVLIAEEITMRELRKASLYTDLIRRARTLAE